MKVYFVRHGETNSNRAKRLMGARNDEPLNNEGKKQAREIAQRLDKNFTRLFSSPLMRAKETAEIIGIGLSLPVIIRDELVEWDAGEFSGKTWVEIETMIPGATTLGALYELIGKDFEKYGGEKGEAIHQRIQQFVNDIKKNHIQEKILVVTHGGIIRTMYEWYADPFVGRLDHMTIHEFEV